MAELDTGGPAFPVPEDDAHKAWEGMTLRDWFAGQVAAGLATHAALAFPPANRKVSRAGRLEALAHEAYSMADAMLAARRVITPPKK